MNNSKVDWMTTAFVVAIIVLAAVTMASIG
jgi:hypothetical protein